MTASPARVSARPPPRSTPPLTPTVLLADLNLDHELLYTFTASSGIGCAIGLPGRSNLRGTGLSSIENALHTRWHGRICPGNQYICLRDRYEPARIRLIIQLQFNRRARLDRDQMIIIG